MSEAEKEVLKTLKKGLGLTSAEQEILVNYIDKLQKENEELKEKYENINWYFENQKDNFVHKNKIRTKIKELEKSKDKEEYIDEYGVRNIPVLNAFIDLKIEVLEELLGDDE